MTFGDARAEPDLTYLLEALRGIPEGEWVQVNQNSFSSVWAPPELRPLRGQSNPEPRKIIEAWGSFAWDSNRGAMMIYGGGHANYPGNDVYRWVGSTGLWERLSLPSEITVDGSGADITVDGPDGAPVSAHVYDNNVFLPIADRFLTFGGAKFAASGAYTRDRGDGTQVETGPYLFDPNRADGGKVGGLTGSHVMREGPFPEILGGEMWQNRDIYANLGIDPQDSNRGPARFVAGATAVTQENGYDVVYVTGSTARGTDQHLYKYTIRSLGDPTADSWELVGDNRSAPSGQGSGSYDSRLNIFVRSGRSDLFFWDLSTPGGDNQNFLPEVISGTFFFNDKMALDYRPTMDHYLIWEGDDRVWEMVSPGTVSTEGWEIRQLPAPTLPAPAFGTLRGVLGKWKYVAQLDAFVGLLNPDDGDVWLYKPEKWADPDLQTVPSLPLPWLAGLAGLLLSTALVRLQRDQASRCR